MKIWVSPLCRVHEVAAEAGAVRAISLLSPKDIFPTLERVPTDFHHKAAMHDIREPSADLTPPGHGHVEEIIHFLNDWSVDDTLIIHCWAGVSRSTATAFTAACLKNPSVDETIIAHSLRAASPTAWPNSRLVGFADDILGRSGRMSRAIEEIGVGAPTLEAEPFFIPAQYETTDASTH